MTTWQRKHFDVAILKASGSKDPRTKVGCVIINPENIELSSGYNGFARKVRDTQERLNDRATKLMLTVHAEANAVAAAARIGHSLLGSTAYVTLPVCAACAGLLIQAGVAKIFNLAENNVGEGLANSDWRASCRIAIDMMEEAGVKWVEF